MQAITVVTGPDSAVLLITLTIISSRVEDGGGGGEDDGEVEAWQTINMNINIILFLPAGCLAKADLMKFCRVRQSPSVFDISPVWLVSINGEVIHSGEMH